MPIIQNKLLIAATIIISSSIALQAQTQKGTNSDQLSLKKIGNPINCIHPRNIRNTNVIDNQTIEFRMHGGTILRNDLGRKCPGLFKGDPISYTIRGSRLCNVDQFTVLRTTAGRIETRARCGFGKFQEIEKVKKEK